MKRIATKRNSMKGKRFLFFLDLSLEKPVRIKFKTPKYTLRRQNARKSQTTFGTSQEGNPASEAREDENMMTLEKSEEEEFDRYIKELLEVHIYDDFTQDKHAIMTDKTSPVSSPDMDYQIQSMTNPPQQAQSFHKKRLS